MVQCGTPGRCVRLIEAAFTAASGTASAFVRAAVACHTEQQSDPVMLQRHAKGRYMLQGLRTSAPGTKEGTHTWPPAMSRAAALNTRL